MEAHKGKFVPTVRKFEIDGSWTPKTPVQPTLSHQMCQHNDNQLPNLNSQGMSTKMTDPTNLSFCKSSLPLSNNGIKEHGSGSGNLLDNDATTITSSLTGNSVLCNQSNLQQSTLHQHHLQKMRDIFGEDLQSCVSPHLYQGTCDDANSPQTTKHADRIRKSTFGPTTPNASWNVASVESHNQVIDLKKTPQTKPRRKRYQPKVLTEKKPRTTPKPKTLKLEIGEKESVQAKRKYVRKNTVNISSTPPTTTLDAAATTKVGAIEEIVTATKSCKKSLNFELNNGNSFSEAQTSKGEDTLLHYGHIVQHLRHGKDSEVETSRGATTTTYELNRSSYYQGLQICLALPAKEPEQIRGTKRDKSSRNATIGEVSKDLIQNIGNEKRTEKVIGAHVSSSVTYVHELDPHMKKINHDSLQPPASSGIPTCIDALTVDSSATNIRSKRKSRKHKSSEQRDFILYDQSARAATGSNLALVGKNTNSSSIDEEITGGPRLSDINRKGCKTLRKGKKALVFNNHEDNQEQNALVAYEGNRTMVPFNGPSNIIKKRAKVDLDKETIKVWNLLVENIDNKGIDGSDEGKEKWWKKERSVFHGRVTSFIARLRLAQGDRSFTPWKGSILDSVIGVFLTQSVSDNLSSSSFMELAAHFPPKLEGSISTLSEQSTTAVNEEPNLQTTDAVMNISSDSSAGTQKPLTVGTNCNYYDSFNSFTGLLKMADNPSLFQSYYQTQLDPLDYMDWTTEGSEAVRSVCPNDTLLDLNVPLPDTMGIDMMEVENSSFKDQSNLNAKTTMQHVAWEGKNMVMKMQMRQSMEQSDTVASAAVTTGVTAESSAGLKRTQNDRKRGRKSELMNANASRSKKGKAKKCKDDAFDWDSLRREAQANGRVRERTTNSEDSLDYEAVRQAQASEIAEAIHDRGLNHMLARRIKELLDRLVKDHGSTDMEWLRDIPPDKAKEYLLSIQGLGLKSVECVRLLSLHHLAFPVDTHVARIVVRLGWVPLQPLPESLQLHLLELYPVLDTIQKYIWPRLCKLDQKTLYELHYHMITFGKVFCTKKNPNCNACPLRADCRHFASAYASARLALPRPEGESSTPSNAANTASPHPRASSNILPLPPQHSQNNFRCVDGIRNCEPIVEVPTTPEPEPDIEQGLCDIEDAFYEDPDEIPEIKLNMEQGSQNVHIYMPTETSTNALALTTEAFSIPPPKLKNTGKLRTEHLVYELPDTHPILKGLDKRVPEDPCSYLFVIWTPGETADSTEPPRRRCNSEDLSILCNEETCSYCNSVREANLQIVRGTLLIPSRTAMRGNFPLNGTYFQVNEVFADHESSLKPISVPRAWLWNLPRRVVYFGTSTVSIFKGLTAEEIQRCFWRGYICVRGFDHKTRAPRPLVANLHFSANKKSRGTKGKRA